jgi:hypothetical protein
MRPKIRRALVPSLAAVALLAAVVLTRGPATRPTAPAGGSSGAPAGHPSGVARQDAVLSIDIAALERPRPKPVEATRDPFRFKPKPPPRPAAPARGDGAQGGASASPAMPAGPPPPPPIPLKFIGIVGTAGGAGKLAVLSDGRSVYYGRDGETIEGRYRIIRIGAESVELAYADGRGRQTIRLTGQ